MKNTLPFALATGILFACGSPQSSDSSVNPSDTSAVTTDTLGYPAWANSANIYEVNVRQYTQEGTLKAFAEHLPRLKEMGVDILWFMPVQPIGEKNRKGGLGSYYSIQDYTAVNPEFGTLDDFKAVVKQAHELGMKVMLDWVANHTAWDHAWMTDHPDYYTQINGKPTTPVDDKGNVTDWTDVADLNYDNQAMRAEMVKAMQFWVSECDIDGFRCDVAGFVPLDFWEETRPQLDSIKQLFMLMEWEAPEYFSAFDMGYGWELHHIMNEVAQDKQPASAFDEYLEKQDSLGVAGEMKMYFTSNHDENSWNGTEFERMGNNHEAMFVLATTFPYGMPLIYSGQEAALDRRLSFFEKDSIGWGNYKLRDFYAEMLRLKTEHPALHHRGADTGFKRIEPLEPAEGAYAFMRTGGGQRIAVFLNFGKEAVSYPSTWITGLEAWSVGKSELTEAGFSLPAGGYAIYTDLP